MIDGQFEKAFSIYADVSITDTHGRFLPEQPTTLFLIQDNVYVIFVGKQAFTSLFCFLTSIWLILYLVLIFQLIKPEVFDFIEKHNLQDAIHEKVCKSKIRCNTYGVTRLSEGYFVSSFSKYSTL